MCVAIVKNKGEKMPSKKTLKKCFIANPDGAGFCYAENGKVFIHKGFMTFGDFYKKLSQFKDKWDNPFLLHFRIATAGNIDGGNTHPFPLTGKVENYRKIELQTDVAFVHNGCLPFKPRDKQISDTIEFGLEFFESFRICNLFSATKFLDNLITGNRLAFLTGDGQVELVGKWHNKGGCLFSNLNHENDYYYLKDYNYDYDYDYGKKAYGNTDRWQANSELALSEEFEEWQKENPELTYDDFLTEYYNRTFNVENYY